MRQATLNDVLLMSAGQELDALVAKMVMGWELNEVNFWNSTDGSYVHYMHYPPHPAYALCDNKYFKPSSRIADTWIMEEKICHWEEITDVSKMTAVDYCKHLKCLLHSTSKKGYATPLDWLHASPELRCKAALMAILERKGALGIGCNLSCKIIEVQKKPQGAGE